MMRILVTGGAGYIGSHTCQILSQAGFQPVVLDNLSAGHRWAVRWGPLVKADLADSDLIRDVIQKHQVEAVIHFAADACVGESAQNPRKYLCNNVIGCLNLLDAMLDTRVTRIIFSSSCATYGIPRQLPIAEDHPQQPVSPYGESKLFIERALRWYGEAYGLRWATLRYFNAAGADPGGELGEAHDPETHLIPLAIQAALGQREHVKVYGSDYSTLDGTAVRDYVHVTDLAEAHVSALKHLLDGGSNVALNLGTSVGHSVRQVIHAIERVGGHPVPARDAPRRPGDPPVLIADSGCATQILGWQHRHSDLETVIKTAWRWHATRVAIRGG